MHMTHDLHIALCAPHPKSHYLLSPHMWSPLPSTTTPPSGCHQTVVCPHLWVSVSYPTYVNSFSWWLMTQSMFSCAYLPLIIFFGDMSVLNFAWLFLELISYGWGLRVLRILWTHILCQTWELQTLIPLWSLSFHPLNIIFCRANF